MNHGRIDGRTTGETWHRARGFSSYGQLGYAPSSGNIGNLKGESYLSAMLQVYSECFKVLKNGGLLVLVTKNFIRNKKIVPLDEDTIKLCEQARFTLIERHYRRLTAQSFWRIIYQQKYPDAPVIDREDILVFRKLWS
jgi:DNA modification methylase